MKRLRCSEKSAILTEKTDVHVSVQSTATEGGFELHQAVPNTTNCVFLIYFDCQVSMPICK